MKAVQLACCSRAETTAATHTALQGASPRSRLAARGRNTPAHHKRIEIDKLHEAHALRFTRLPVFFVSSLDKQLSCS